jgi:ABC-type transporter Mla maintaining outer membrane lipid asymmetry ATPase subunit MlaF
MLWDGRFIADGTADDLTNSQDEHVRRFVHGRAEPQDLATLST